MKTANLIVCGALAAAAGAFAAKPTKLLNSLTPFPCSSTMTLSRDTVWHMQGKVFVGQNAGCPQELVIQSGTVVKGMPGDTTNASVLVISKWGKIQAVGTAAQPIVFTTVYDNEEDPSDLGAFDRGLWGGVILLGNATISEGTAFIEGIPAEPRAEFGGSNDVDSSGRMSYVSIRHGGKLLGNANEINGLTFGGVGSKTVIDHIECFATNDDGFEWFGGTVNAKYLISAYGNDDLFDFDFGYKGKLQYGFGIYHNGNTDPSGNQGIEGDGFAFPLAGGTDTTKYSKPKWSNLTLIGNGNPQTISTANDLAFRLRDGTAGDFKNMIVQDFRLNAGRIELQGALACDAVCKLNRDELNVEGSWFWNFGNWFGSFSDILVAGIGADSLSAKNSFANPLLNSVGQTLNSVDPRPAPTSPAVTGTHYQMGDPFFDNVTYAGAFSPSENWMNGWTAISQMGIGKKYLRLEPAAGSTATQPIKLFRPANWDFTILQNMPVAVNINASTASLDGADVSSTFRAGVWPSVTVLPNGDRAYMVRGLGGSTLGAAGKHTLHLRMVLSNGVVLEDDFYWETVQ